MENKTGKYLKYAIGEIFLVVIGILIALQINNWNEIRKQKDKSQQLIGLLIEDFEYNSYQIKQELKYTDSVIAVMDTYNKLIASEIQLVEVDSLRELAISFFRGFNLNINLAAYTEAKSTGSLSLLRDKKLQQQFTKFIDEYNSIIGLQEEGRYSYFNGSSWELRKTVDINLLRGSEALGNTITYADYKTLVGTPLAKAAIDNVQTINYNVFRKFSFMDKSAEIILEILQTLKKD